MLNGLARRDRHEKLPVVAAGMGDVYLRNFFPDGTFQDGFAQPNPLGFFEDGAVIGSLPDGVVDVQIAGTPRIVIRSGHPGLDMPIPDRARPVAFAISASAFSRGSSPYLVAD